MLQQLEDDTGSFVVKNKMKGNHGINYRHLKNFYIFKLNWIKLLHMKYPISQI